MREAEGATRETTKRVMEEQAAAARADDLDTASAPDGDRWAFDENVTAAFEDMLERSIPNYAGMRRIVTDATVWFISQLSYGAKEGFPLIVDLGASRGSALAPIVDRLGVHARYTAIEVAPPMVEVLKDRFSGWIEADRFKVVEADLRGGLPGVGGLPFVYLSVLTLQFIPMEYRQTLLRQVYESLRPGGALIIVEKVLGRGWEAEQLLIDLYHGLKRSNGYAKEAVERKAMALEGVLVPLTARENEERLRDAGFDLVETIWAWCNFRAWLAVKR
jgi:tRNA (cmo5U34)-methyltransferase